VTDSLVTVRVEEARILLAEARTVDDVKELADQARAIEQYARRRSAASQAHADAWEIVQLASRRLGQLTSELPQAPAGRKPKQEISNGPLPISKGEVLKELGVSKMQASRWEAMARLDDGEFAAQVERGKAAITKKGDAGGGIGSTSNAAGYDSDNYGTPPEVLDVGRELLGGDFDLDPCSNAEAQKIVRARVFWTKEDNCLAQKVWKARRMWMNPPYSRIVKEIIKRLHVEIEAGHIKTGLVLVNNTTDTTWFHSMMRHYPTWFSEERLAFIANGEPLEDTRQGQAAFYIGPKLPAFRRLFEKKLGGLVMVH
jgi:phage N-6-adenine-methyltransferase